MLFGLNLKKKASEEEIISMVDEGHEQGTILASEAQMIHNVLKFDEKEVKDIMTHRGNMVCLDGELSFLEAVDIAVSNGKSRFPVYENDIDNIIGVLHIKDILKFFHRNEIFRTPIKEIEDLIRPVEFFPETVGINDLFKNMQNKKSHIVIVIDEYGQVSGLVAMEDILEEIVGEIKDEHDDEEELIKKHDDTTFIMDGLTEFSDVKEALELPVMDDEFETLNGFLISLSDKIPEEGDKTVIRAYGYEFSVLEVEDKVIKQVLIKNLAPNNKE